MKIAVLGAGIVGTSSAVRLKKAFPNAELHLIASSFSPGTTSDGSGGFWQPHLIQNTPEELINYWARQTFLMCENLWRNDVTPELKGLEKLLEAVSLVPCYDLQSKHHHHSDDKNPLWTSVVYDYRWMTPQQVQELGWSKNIGHVLRVKAPWMHHVLACAEDVYVIPNKDGLVVGSVNKFNNWDTSLNSHNNEDAQLILDRCADQLCLPRLKQAPILSQWVGLRPFRLEGVKLEHELYQDKLHVIHNYGHGGCGVTLSWGCAGTVVQLVKDHVIKNKAKM